MEEKVISYAIDPESINWDELKGLGVSREALEKTGNLEKLLNYGRTDLFSVGLPWQDGKVNFASRLSFVKDGDGVAKLRLHPVQRYLDVSKYMGYEFSKEDQRNMLHDGNLGKVVELQAKNGERFSAYLSADPLTNEILATKVTAIKIPDVLLGATLTEDQKKELSEGKKVELKGLTAANGSTYDCKVQVSAFKRGIDFIFDDKLDYKQRYMMAENYKNMKKKEPSQSQTESQNNKLVQKGDNFYVKPLKGYVAPKEIAGKALSDKQRAALEKGAVLYVKDMVNKAGEKFNSYISAPTDKKTGVEFHKFLPKKKEEVKEEVKTETKVETKVENNENKEVKKSGFKKTSTKKEDVSKGMKV